MAFVEAPVAESVIEGVRTGFVEIIVAGGISMEGAIGCPWPGVRTCAASV